MDEQGWAVEVWDDDKGIRFSKGPTSCAVSMGLLIDKDKGRALESMADVKLGELFVPEDGFDDEPIHTCWWTLFSPDNLKILVKRLQAVLETEEVE